MVRMANGEIIKIDTGDFIKIADRLRNDSRFLKGEIINILEGIWDTDNIQCAIVDYININRDKIEFEDLINDLEDTQ